MTTPALPVLVTEVAQLEQLRARLKAAIAEGAPIGYDSESFGPEFKHNGKTRPDATRHRIAGYSLAFTDGTKCYVPLRHGTHWEVDGQGEVRSSGFDLTDAESNFLCSAWKLLRFVQQPKAVVWAHNWKFDFMVLQNEGLEPKCQLWDSELLAWMAGMKVVSAKNGLALKVLAKVHLKYNGPTFEDVAQGRPANEVPPAELAPYAANDAWLTLQLGLKAKARVESLKSLGHYPRVEQRCVPVSAHLERTGAKLDTAKLLAAAERCDAELATVAAEFRKLTECDGVLLPVKVREPKPCPRCADQAANGVCPGAEGKRCVGGILHHKNGRAVLHSVMKLQPVRAGADIGSDQQVSRWLFVELGWWRPLPGHPQVKYGPSVKADYVRHYAALSDGNARLAAHLRLRFQALRKYSSTYTRTLVALAAQSGDGRLHTSYKQDGTDTVRYSSSMPNQSNLPKSERQPLPWLKDLPDIRDCFITDPGWVICIYDLNAIEMRIMAHYSRDPELMREFLDGVDGHELMRQRMGGTADRSSAKITRFSTIYRIKAQSLASKLRLGTNDYTITEEVAQGYIDGFYDRHPLVADYQERAVQWAERNGGITNVTGFFRPIGPWKGRSRWGSENRAINTPIQASAGSILKLALADLYEGWKAERDGVLLGRDVRLVQQTYDEIGAECRAEVAELVCRHMQTTMEAQAAAVGLRVPIKAAGGSGLSWSAAK